MSTQLYRKADRADEMNELDLKKTDPTCLLRALYENWISATADMRSETAAQYDDDDGLPMRKFYDSVAKDLYKQAKIIAAPFRKEFTGTLSSRDFPLMGFYEERYTLGCFLSALLDCTDADMLIVTGVPKVYRIDVHGKILKIDSDAEFDFVCSNVIVINHGYVHMIGGKGALCVNYGEVDGMSRLTDDEDCTGIYISKCEAEWSTYSPGRSCVIEPDELAEDTMLSTLLDSMESASKAADVPTIKKLAKNIDAHVRENKKHSTRIARRVA